MLRHRLAIRQPSLRIILPKTSRVSMRSRALPISVEIDLGVDDRVDQAARHLLHGVGHVLHAAAERADEAQLLLEQHHQVHLSVETPEVEPQVTRRPPRFSDSMEPAQVSADMFEDDIDAALLRQLADDALEAVLAVVDDMIGAQRLGRLDLGVGTDGGDDRAAHLLGELDRRRADAGAAGMDRIGFARLQSGIVEQHVLDRAEGDRRDRRAHRRRRRAAPARDCARAG
jgi:hypothetical protein